MRKYFLIKLYFSIDRLSVYKLNSKEHENDGVIVQAIIVNSKGLYNF